MSTIAIAIYDKGYSRFDSLRVPVEILIAKDKKAWCELLDAFLNIIIHSKGDPAADFILNGIGKKGTKTSTCIPGSGRHA